MQKVDINNVQEVVNQQRPMFDTLRQQIAQVVVGNEDVLNHITIAMLCNGHVLLEGVPGVAKTTIIKSFAQALGLKFQRIQFTPDLLPADLIGTLIYNPKTHEFDTKKGPIFANLILADEINRAPAKVQSALLEAMQEKQVTIGATTFELEKPFFVFATQNPVEQEGTYTLPEAQVDRFMFKILVDYPTKENEKEIILRNATAPIINQAIDQKTILELQETVRKVYVDSTILDYIVNLVFATRMPQEFKNKALSTYIQYGVSPRGGIVLYHGAQAHAFLEGRSFVTPDDVKAVAYAILRHRIQLNYEAEADNITSDEIIGNLLRSVPTP
ncbi:MAG TPA: MoxR family ATPase [Candidatus Babeliales bacterium]|nr:MoxR family ATPase [Candidatus Babeliales bacterium]